MRAFLKRRWFLLSLVVVLMAGSCVTIYKQTVDADGGGREEVGIIQGSVFYANCRYATEKEARASRFAMDEFTTGLHMPNFGYLPGMTVRPGRDFLVLVPFWIPLSVVFGWLVIRELWRREKFFPPPDKAKL